MPVAVREGPRAFVFWSQDGVFCDFGIFLDEVEAVQNPAYEIAGGPR